MKARIYENDIKTLKEFGEIVLRCSDDKYIVLELAGFKKR